MPFLVVQWLWRTFLVRVPSEKNNPFTIRSMGKLVLACLHAEGSNPYQPVSQITTDGAASGYLLLVKCYHSEPWPSASTSLRELQEGVLNLILRINE